MRQKILEDHEPKCEYCAFGELTFDGESVTCVKRGVCDKNDSCKKYRYDPLKRVPREQPTLPEFSEEDFKL